MITKRRMVALATAMLVVGIALPASAIFNSFGDSSWWLGTGLDGGSTVCSEGFDFTVAYSPNEVFEPGNEIGTPTGFADGDLGPVAPTWQIYPASQILIDNGDGTYGSTLPNLAWADAGDGTNRLVYTDVPSAPDRFGVFGTDVFYDDLYFAVDGIDIDPSTPRPVAAIGMGSIVADMPMPVGDDMAFIGSNILEGSTQIVEIVACTADDVTVDAKPYGKSTKVKPGKGKIKVAVLNDGAHDLSTLTDVTAGVDEATPIKYKAKDVDGDGDLDAEFVFKVAETGVECGDITLPVQGTVDGLSFNASADIVTKC